MRKPKPIVIAGIMALVIATALALAVRMLLGGDRIKAAIEAQATATLGHPVTIRTAMPRLLPRVGLDLTGVTVGAAREVTIERVRLITGLRALIQRRVEDADVSVERSQIDVRWALALLGALADSSGPAAPAASSSYALTVDSISALGLREVTLVAGKHSLLVDLDSSLIGGDRFVVSQMHGQSAFSNFWTSGEFTSMAHRTGAFDVDAETLDLDGLLTFLAAATPAGARQLAPRGENPPQPARLPLHIDIAVRARQGRALGVALTNLTTTCRMTNGDVLLDDLRVELFGGRYAGTAAFRGAAGEPRPSTGSPGSGSTVSHVEPSTGSGRPESIEGRYEWRGTFENLDVPMLVRFAGAPRSITGRLAGTLSLAATGADPLQAVRHARGPTHIAITDGRIPGLEIVRSVILAFGKPSGERPAGSGEAFTRLAATLSVSGPNTFTTDLTFSSRDFDMIGEGTLSLASQAIDFRTDVILSRELSTQAGRDLYRLARDDDRIVLPARITGTVSSPAVFVDVQGALRRALRNRAEDELKSLVERWRKRVMK